MRDAGDMKDRVLIFEGVEAGVIAEGALRAEFVEVDVAFELAGNDLAVDQAMALVRPGGRVVLGGIPGDDRTCFTASLARRKGLTIAMVRRTSRSSPGRCR